MSQYHNSRVLTAVTVFLQPGSRGRNKKKMNENCCEVEELEQLYQHLTMHLLLDHYDKAACGSG